MDNSPMELLGMLQKQQQQQREKNTESVQKKANSMAEGVARDRGKIEGERGREVSKAEKKEDN